MWFTCRLRPAAAQRSTLIPGDTSQFPGSLATASMWQLGKATGMGEGRPCCEQMSTLIVLMTITRAVPLCFQSQYCPLGHLLHFSHTQENRSKKAFDNCFFFIPLLFVSPCSLCPSTVLYLNLMHSFRLSSFLFFFLKTFKIKSPVTCQAVLSWANPASPHRLQSHFLPTKESSWDFTTKCLGSIT